MSTLSDEEKSIELSPAPATDNHESHDSNIVDWDENESNNPHNWATSYKCWITFQLGMLALAASLGSSIIAPAETRIAAYVGVSLEVVILSVSLYM